MLGILKKAFHKQNAIVVVGFCNQSTLGC